MGGMMPRSRKRWVTTCTSSVARAIHSRASTNPAHSSRAVTRAGRRRGPESRRAMRSSSSDPVPDSAASSHRFAPYRASAARNIGAIRPAPAAPAVAPASITCHAGTARVAAAATRPSVPSTWRQARRAACRPAATARTHASATIAAAIGTAAVHGGHPATYTALIATSARSRRYRRRVIRIGMGRGFLVQEAEVRAGFRQCTV